jgi:hypothetical protein
MDVLFLLMSDEERESEIPVKKNETEKSAAKVPAKDVKKDKQANDKESDDFEDDSEDEETSVSEVGKKRVVTTA